MIHQKNQIDPPTTEHHLPENEVDFWASVEVHIIQNLENHSYDYINKVK